MCNMLIKQIFCWSLFIGTGTSKTISNAEPASQKIHFSVQIKWKWILYFEYKCTRPDEIMYNIWSINIPVVVELMYFCIFTIGIHCLSKACPTASAIEVNITWNIYMENRERNAFTHVMAVHRFSVDDTGREFMNFVWFAFFKSLKTFVKMAFFTPALLSQKKHFQIQWRVVLFSHLWIQIHTLCLVELWFLSSFFLIISSIFIVALENHNVLSVLYHQLMEYIICSLECLWILFIVKFMWISSF